MIRCAVSGSSKDILRFRTTLKDNYKEKYSTIVTESIPEAVAHDVKSCTAVFVLDVRYFDFKIFNTFVKSEFSVSGLHGRYRKPRGYRKGFWEEPVNGQYCVKNEKEKSNYSCDGDLHEYEDLESWEIRNGYSGTV